MCLIASFILLVLYVLFYMSFIFPLPINDAGSVRYRSIPWATFLLIFLNSAIFLLWLAPDLYNPEVMVDGEFPYDYVTKISSFGYRETVLRNGEGVGAFTTFTSMFMHADLLHLFGNMIYLWTFGRRIEDACGHGRYLVFYLLSGMVANLGSELMNPLIGDRPGIGASGAIAGIMGAYLLLYPGAKVTTLWGVGSILRVPISLVRIMLNQKAIIWGWRVTLPAWLLLLWFAFENTLFSFSSMKGEDTGGINYLAHLAGFLAALTIFLFVRKDLLMRYISGRSL